MISFSPNQESSTNQNQNQNQNQRGIAREIHDLFSEPKLLPPKVGRSTSSHEAADFLSEPITSDRVLLTSFKIATCLAQKAQYDRSAEIFLAVFRKADLHVIKNFLTRTCIESTDMVDYIKVLLGGIR